MKAGPLAVRTRYETVFSLFLLILAFFFRGHAAFAYPAILYTFGAFLLFNFLFNRFLRERSGSRWPAHASIAMNSVLISCAVTYSGGAASYLWVMYLLPLFSACLLFSAEGIAASLAVSLGLHAWVFAHGAGPLSPEDWLTLLSRSALLVLACVVTAWLAASERTARAEAERQRKRWENALNAPAPGGVKTLLDGGLHDLNNTLAVILGGTQMALLQVADEEVSQDLRRVETAVRLGKLITQNVALASRREWAVAPVSIQSLVEEALAEARPWTGGHLRRAEFTAKRDDVEGNATLLKQACVNWICAVSQKGELRVRVTDLQRKGKPVVRVEVSAVVEEPQAARAAAPPRGVRIATEMSRKIFEGHGGAAGFEEDAEGARYWVDLPPAEKVPARGGETRYLTFVWDGPS